MSWRFCSRADLEVNLDFVWTKFIDKPKALKIKFLKFATFVPQTANYFSKSLTQPDN
jgi:hypothetical protein